jgi:hypothetical protein
VDGDLKVFFKHNFDLIREERSFEAEWPSMCDIQRLVENSCGLFIWAYTACRFIREGRKFAKKRLSTLINEHGTGTDPEKQLDEVYTTVLKNSIQQGYSDEERKELHEMFKQVLGSIVLLYSPLSIHSLAEMVSLTTSEVEETLADLHTIFHIPSETSRPIFLHHPVFREFILNQDRCRDLNFWIDAQPAHEDMANNCIQLMSKKLKKNICGLTSPSVFTKDVDRELINKCISPELQYACLYWVRHCRESGMTLQDGDRASEFFQNFFLHWLEVIVLIGKGSEVAATLRMYSSFITVRGHSLSNSAM